MLGRNILESVDFMVSATIDALESKDGSEIAILANLTQDRTAMMAKLRHAYFSAEEEMNEAARSYVLDMTILLENVVQTLSRYGTILAS